MCDLSYIRERDYAKKRRDKTLFPTIFDRTDSCLNVRVCMETKNINISHFFFIFTIMLFCPSQPQRERETSGTYENEREEDDKSFQILFQYEIV